MMLVKNRYISVLVIVLCVLGCSEDIQDPTKEQDPTRTTVYRITAMGAVEGTLYLAAGEEGVFRLNTQNRSWESLPMFLSAESLVFEGGTLYIGSWGEINRLVQWDPPTLIELPITKPQGQFSQPVEALAVGNNTTYAIEGNKLFFSKDGGSKWDEINTTGHVDESILSMAVQANTIYVSAYLQGVFRSLDGGLKWRAINQGLPDIRLLIPPLIFNQNTLYIGTENGVYRLPEGTTIWLPAGLPHLSVNALMGTDNALYAGVWGTGVFRSDDGGENWRHIGLKGIRVTAFTVVGNRLFVGASNRKGVFYTDDEGANWHPLNKGLTNIIE